MTHLRLDLGHELDRRGARADHRDAPAGQVVGMVPAGGVKHRALKRVQPRQVGDRWIGQGTDRGDEDLGSEVPAGGVDLPAVGVVVPGGLEHLVAIADGPREVVVARDVVDVGLDLGLPGEGVGPAGVLLVSVGVQDAGDVAGAPGIAVVAPRAAQVIGTLEHDEVLDAVTAQGDGHPQAGQARARDRDLDLSSLGVGHAVSSFAAVRRRTAPGTSTYHSGRSANR
jgi:hypothetical protein